MAIRNRLARIKSSLFPKLVFDRTLLDKQIEALTKDRDSLILEIDALRASATDRTFAFEGYDIPIDLMMMTGGGPDTFEMISRQHTLNLRKWVGLEPEYAVLEIGCGIGRDAIPLTKILTAGRYIGIDIIGRSIEWCKAHISAHHPNFEFHHYDVSDQLHNPTGGTATTDIRLPAHDQSVDRIILFSVFTHMLRGDIEHYLREFRRVLKPSGLVFATTFIFDDAILASARATNLTPFDLRFEHEIEQGCRINVLEHPLGAVAFTNDAWDGMVERSGLKYAKRNLKGGWSGFYSEPEDGQDVVILTPSTT